MKLAYTVSTPDTNGKYLAYRGETKVVFSVLKDIGYHGVEAFVRDPREMDQEKFCEALDKYGLALAAVGTGPAAAEDKLTFTSPDPSVRSEAIARAKAAVDFASLLGAQVNIGKLRGEIYKGDPVQAIRLRDEAFKEVCEYAAAKNTYITLEPQCRFAVDNLNSTQEAIAWIRKMNLTHLFLMLDVFHMNIEDRSQAESFILAQDLNIHMHFADNNRGIPGTGNIDFVDAIRVLRALGYKRYISMEIEQDPDCCTAARAAFEYVQRLLSED